MTIALTIALNLIVLHSVGGHEIVVNPAHITVIHETAAATGQENKLLVQGANCVLGLANGKLIAVKEQCHEVKKLLEK